jgi:hypothetical protein
VRGNEIGLWRFLRISKRSSWLHEPWADGAASVATFMAIRPAASSPARPLHFPLLKKIRTALGGEPRITDIVYVATLLLV